ncbi:MAG TPA: dipeptide epimerase, partial [Bacteroidales bacterium]|nr:dipeptide epimerase [Bacteroidales bacterium]
MKKRDFIKYGGLLTGAMISSTFTSCGNNSGGKTGVRSRKTSPIKLTYTPYTLQLKHVFTLAAGSRTTTPVVLTKLECDGFVGYGEASMPPYLGESHESVQKFLSRVNMEQFSDPFLIEDILEYATSKIPKEKI